MIENILKNLVRKYSSCNSYQDSGAALGKVTLGGQILEDSRISFSTKFVKPQFVRFEFSNSALAKRHLLVSDGDSVRMVLLEDEEVLSVEVAPDLKAAVESYTGVSGGLVPILAGLLLPAASDGLKMNIVDLIDLESLGDETVNGVKCIGIRGLRKGSEYKLWISKDDMKLLRLSFLKVEDDSMREKRTRFLSQLNEFNRDQELPEIENCSDYVTVTSEFHFDNVVFNDSINVESVLEF